MRYDALLVLETERLRLRPITIDDVPDIYAYAKDPQVSRLLVWESPASINETQKVVQQWIANYRANKQAPWGIVDKETNTVIGTIDTRHYDPEEKSAMIGYCLSREYWGKGLMPEALHCVLNYLFTQTDVTEIAATCRVDNPQSQRVLEKVGMHKQPGKKERKKIKGSLVELERFVILKNEWFAD